MYIIMLSKLSWLFFLIIISSHVLIFTRLIYYPYPELFIYPYLTNHGFKPYGNILDQHFPGLLFLPINFDNLGLHNEVIARYWSAGIIILIHLMLFLIVSKLLNSRKKALLVNVLYLLWQPFFEGWVLWIDSFLPIILLPAFYSFHKKKFLLTGLLVGLGIVFKQTLIPLAGLILLYLIWEVREIGGVRAVLRYLAGLVLPVALMLIYLLGIGVLNDFWYWTIVFNLTVFAKSGTTIPSAFSFIIRPLVVYSGALLALFHKDRKLKVAMFIFLIGSLAGIFDRADYIHYQPSLPFVLLATVLGVDQIKQKKLLCGLIIVYLTVAGWWLNTFYKGHLGSRVFFFDSQTKQLAAKIKVYTRPREKIFIFGAAPHLYQMTDTLPAGNIFVFQFPWFLEVAESRVLLGIEKDRPAIIVADTADTIEGQPITKFASSINDYIRQNYQAVDQAGTAVIMRRKVP